MIQPRMDMIVNQVSDVNQRGSLAPACSVRLSPVSSAWQDDKGPSPANTRLRSLVGSNSDTADMPMIGT